MNRLFSTVAIFAIYFIVLCMGMPAITWARQKIAMPAPTVSQRVLDPDALIAGKRIQLQHSIAIDSPDGAFMALIVMSIKYWEKQEFAAMRGCCEAALPWAKRSPQKDAVAWAYSNMGESYY